MLTTHRGRLSENSKSELESGGQANDMESCESKVDSTSSYDANLKQKVENADPEKIVFGHNYSEMSNVKKVNHCHFDKN